MSVEVCVLANWEADGYEKWLHNRDILRELASATAEERDKLRPLLQAAGSHPDCRNHRHFKLSTAREMVDGFRVERIVDGRVQEIFVPPTAKWVGPGTRRIAALVQPRERLRDLSARSGFDRKSHTINLHGDPMSMAADGNTDWIGSMLAMRQHRVKQSKTKLRKGKRGKMKTFIPGTPKEFQS